MIDKFSLAILTIFGIGHIKYAPGTIASAVTCILFYISWDIFDFYFVSKRIYIVFLILLILVYSIILIDKYSHNFKKKDPKEIIVDEFVGQLIPLVTILYLVRFDDTIRTSFVHDGWNEFLIIISFILFRFFDIFKPYPINTVDKKIKSGLGIMLDDVIAGIYTSIVITFLYLLVLK